MTRFLRSDEFPLKQDSAVFGRQREVFVGVEAAVVMLVMRHSRKTDQERPRNVTAAPPRRVDVEAAAGQDVARIQEVVADVAAQRGRGVLLHGGPRLESAVAR